MPQDLAEHRCINLRLPTAGGLYAWELEKGARDLRVRVDGQLVFNNPQMIVRAALDGLGLACVLEDLVADQVAEWQPRAGAGRLVSALRGISPLLSQPAAALGGVRAPGRSATLPTRSSARPPSLD